MSESSGQSLQARNQRLLMKLVVLTLAMFGFGFALVPLYDVFCDVTGIKGVVREASSGQTDSAVDLSRSIKVTFVTNTDRKLPWTFKAEQTEVVVHPGETGEAMFTVSNPLTLAVTGQAVHNLLPGASARYFSKTECFCFTQQTLQPGETREMPLRFVIDPAMPAEISEITLGYTFFELARGADVAAYGPN
ncbi:MAG: cytochrome c oxidase assembly protein [Gammaproteobacteria bacterium]|nr:cytochrome c oxidase assembly protein [Gammaproteobacteria bacterium]